MKTNIILKIVNPLLAVALVFQVVTGLLHGILPREMFETIHGTSAGILMVFVILHLLLNWNWIKANYLKKD
jgi:uncharacterized membrane protein YfcA